MSAEQLPPEAAGVTVARVLRAHGRRGEVAAEILTDFPERLKQLGEAQLWDAKHSTSRRVVIRSCRLTQSRGGQAILHFEGSDSISEAEKLVGLEVRIPLSARMPLEAGSYYVTDLIGCDVCEKGAAGAPPLGVVRDVQFTGEDVAGTPLLILDSPHGELLIPLAQDICVQVDIAARRIDVILPEGLRDLNRNS